MPCTGAGQAGFALFGVFDGHGGKQVATFASKHMASRLLDALPCVDATHEDPESVRPMLKVYTPILVFTVNLVRWEGPAAHRHKGL